jgi:hypothetical protein
MRWNGPIASALASDSWTSQFVNNIHSRLVDQRILSTAQAAQLLKLITRFQNEIAITHKFDLRDIKDMLDRPIYRQVPYETKFIPNEVRYLGDNVLGFRFKRNDTIIEDLKYMKPKVRDLSWKVDQFPTFDNENKIWNVPVHRDNYETVVDFISKHNFGFDDDVAEYLTLCANSKGKPSGVAYDPDSEQFIFNICDNEILSAWIKNVLYGEIL